jgi:hypothetical protein
MMEVSGFMSPNYVYVEILPGYRDLSLGPDTSSSNSPSGSEC